MGGPTRGAFAFPRAARMRSPDEFKYVLHAGRRWAGVYIDVCVAAGKDPQRKLGIVCGRRVGKAHDRNQVKRRIREIVRTHPALLRDGVWCVVVAKPRAPQATFQGLRAEVLEGLVTLYAGEIKTGGGRR